MKKKYKFEQTFTEKDIHHIISEKQIDEIKELLNKKISDERMVNEIARFFVFSGFNCLQSSHLPRGTIIFEIGRAHV